MKEQSKKVNKNRSKHLRIDAGIHQLLKIEAIRHQMSLQNLVEGYLVEALPLVKGEINK